MHLGRAMRKVISYVTSVLLLGAVAHTTQALEKTIEFSVQASASVQESPARITLHWPQDSCNQPENYTIYRKAPGASSWGKPVSVPGSALEYVDNDVTTAVAYEYQVVKSAANYTGY